MQLKFSHEPKLKMMSEKNILSLSVYAALFTAVLAIIWGVLGNSKVILFDGIYSMISVGLSTVSLWSASYIKKRDNARFPFGKEMIEPLVILTKFLVIAALCLFALFSGISTMLSGGQQVDPGSGMLYAFIASSICMATYLYIRKEQRRLNSGFVLAELQQWLMDFYLSFAVLLGFSLSFLLLYMGYNDLVHYMDPLMVILVSAYFLKVPIVSMGKQLKEVLDMTAEEQYTLKIEEITGRIQIQYKFQETFTRVAKSGTKLFIEIDFVLSPEGWQPTLLEQDAIREEIMGQMRDISLKKWLNVAFTLDRKWAV